MKPRNKEKPGQLSETNVSVIRLPLAFPELAKHRQSEETLGGKTSGVANYQRAQVMLLAFGLVAAVAGAVLALRAAVWVPG
jgi:hypothetical protein